VHWEREAVQRERENVQREREAVYREREAVQREREAVYREREAVQREREAVHRDRDRRARARRNGAEAVEAPADRMGAVHFVGNAVHRVAYRIVLARRIARITAGALLLAASFGFVAIAVYAPSMLTAATVASWLAGLLAYAVVRVAVAVRGGLARRRGGPLAVSKDGARFRAYRLQNASTFVPYVGTLATFVLPLGWMVDSLGAGAALSALAMMASAVVVYAALRAVLDRELAELGIDAVGGRR
jgi:hypothetical protein